VDVYGPHLLQRLFWSGSRSRLLTYIRLFFMRPDIFVAASPDADSASLSLMALRPLPGSNTTGICCTRLRADFSGEHRAENGSTKIEQFPWTDVDAALVQQILNIRSE